MKNVNFSTFMANNAQANFNVVRKVFGSQDKVISMIGKEKTC